MGYPAWSRFFWLANCYPAGGRKCAMRATEPKVAEYKVGTYICPNTKSPVSLSASRPLAYLDWPVVVETCSDCGQRHVLQCEEVHHPPAFGYE